MSANKPVLLVTGGAGYIGSHLVSMALAAGYFVHVLDQADPETDPLKGLFLRESVRYFKGSITDIDILQNCLTDVDYVVHLAGVSDGRAGKENPELTRKVNSESMMQLLDTARSAGVQRFIFASTMGVYGNQYQELLHEELPVYPVDPYSESKAIGETFVSRANVPGFCTISLRIAMVYGIGQKVREDFLVNRLCINAVREGKLSVVGGSQKRPQIHIDDLCRLFLELLLSDENTVCSATFNAVECNPDILEIVQTITEILPDTKVEMLPSRLEEDSFEMDGRKLAKETGFHFQADLKTGIRQIINHYNSRAN